MPAWVKAMVAVAVALVPGAFVALSAYALARAIHGGYKQARLEANGKTVHVRAVLKQVHVRDVVRHARLVA